MFMTNSLIKAMLDEPTLWKSTLETTLLGFSLDITLFRSPLRASIVSTCIPWSVITLAEGMDVSISSIEEAKSLSTSLRAGINACSKHLSAHGGAGRLVLARFPKASFVEADSEFTVGQTIKFTIPEDLLSGPRRSRTFRLTFAWSNDKLAVKLQGDARLCDHVMLDVYCNDRAKYIYMRENLIPLQGHSWTDMQGLAMFGRKTSPETRALDQEAFLAVFIREVRDSRRRCFKIGHALNLDRPNLGLNNHEYYA